MITHRGGMHYITPVFVWNQSVFWLFSEDSQMSFLFSICSFSHPWTSLVQPVVSRGRGTDRQTLFWKLSVSIPVRDGEVALDHREQIVFGCRLSTFPCSRIQQEINTGKTREKKKILCFWVRTLTSAPIPEMQFTQEHKFCPQKDNQPCHRSTHKYEFQHVHTVKGLFFVLFLTLL